MIIALCLIIIAVAMRNFKRPQLIISINFLHHPIILGAFEYLFLKTCHLSLLCLCVCVCQERGLFNVYTPYSSNR